MKEKEQEIGFTQFWSIRQPHISGTVIHLSHLIDNPLSRHSSFAIMDFSELINNYKENDSETSSPIWIWFKRKEDNDVVCQICKTNIQCRDASTGQMTQHLKRHHNFLKKYNAYKEFEDLSALKQTRLNNQPYSFHPLC